MHLLSLSLFQFKNHTNAKYTFSKKLNAIVGNNGNGKTNLLDAIYMLSFTKSYFSKNDFANVQFDTLGFRIEGNYMLAGEMLKMEIIFRENNKKEILSNGILIKKHADIIGNIPAIMISPDDIDLINGASEKRRAFLDKLISQINKQYLVDVMDYNKIIAQKNALLKNWHITKQYNLLEIYNTQLGNLTKTIYPIRQAFTNQLFEFANSYYKQIADNNYEINFEYKSQLNAETWEDLLKKYSQQEIDAQKTLIGMHKDDLLFKLTNNLFKDTASQGQKKSLLLALKLGEIMIIKKQKNIYPLLLLDDVFEKLDDLRLSKFFTIVFALKEMQIFLTDVNEKRVHNKIKGYEQDYTVISL